MIDVVDVKGREFKDSKPSDIDQTIQFGYREFYHFGPWHSDALVVLSIGHYMGGNAVIEVDGRNHSIIEQIMIQYRRNGIKMPSEPIEREKPYEVTLDDIAWVIGPKHEGFTPSIVIIPELLLASTNNRARR